MREFIEFFHKGKVFQLILAFVILQAIAHSGAPREHEPLQLKNNFTRPEQVISYYCARDASGFVWSGLLEAERKAFTTWSEIPQHDTFYVADQYALSPPVFDSRDASKASVEVTYHIKTIADAHGTQQTVQNSNLVVKFELKKQGSQWKIVKPLPQDVPPVVLESKFPVVASL